ncbi:MAG: AI-2E family transporter [Opitutae bacterium]|nr:AI-2E family transporter [Opitutae bacterium]
MPVDDTPLLSPTQRRLAGFALSTAAIVGVVAVIYLALLVTGRFVSQFSGVIWPLAVAGILALILRPLVALFERRLKLRRPVAVLALYGLFLVLAAGLLATFVPALVAQIVDFFAYLPTLWQNTLAWGEQHFPEWLAVVRRYLDNPAVKAAANSLMLQAQDLLAQITPSLKQAGAGLFGLFGFVASVAVVPIYLFFFLLTDEEPTKGLPAHLPFLKEAQRNDVVFLVREFLGILVAFFRGQLLIGLIMGTLLAIGFSVAGLRFGLALGLIIGLLNIVPYLGTILGLSVALPLALFQPDGGLWLVGVCLAVFVGVQAIEGWLLTPRIMGRQTGLHPVAIIFAVFFWGQALGGILGLMLAVPLTAFFVTAWRYVRRKYFATAGV